MGCTAGADQGVDEWPSDTADWPSLLLGRVLAVAVRVLRLAWRIRSSRNPLYVSRPARAAVPARRPADAVVPQQTDHPARDADSVAARNSAAPEGRHARAS